MNWVIVIIIRPTISSFISPLLFLN